MSESKPKNSGNKSERLEREARALRKNLHRRKQQERERKKPRSDKS